MNVTSLSATKIGHKAQIVRHGFINFKCSIDRNVQACTIQACIYRNGRREMRLMKNLNWNPIDPYNFQSRYPQHKFCFSTNVGNIKADKRTIHSRLW